LSRRAVEPGIPREQRGFALLIVLWVLVLIALIVGHVAGSGRTELRIAGNLAANAVTQAAADGAIYEAIFHLSEAQPGRRWPPDGQPHELRIGDSAITVWIYDEAARINPNIAPLSLLQGLLQAVGVKPEQAADLAQSIGEWVGSEEITVSGTQIAAEYRAAGLDYAPPRAPLESLDELRRVRGMTEPLLAALKPHLTLFGPAAPDPASADPAVIAAIAFASGDPNAAPAAANAPAIVTARIRVTAHGPSNAEISRMSVVRISRLIPQGFSLLAWGDTLE
jgi:general secretion pathway protein K